MAEALGDRVYEALVVDKPELTQGEKPAVLAEPLGV